MREDPVELAVGQVRREHRVDLGRPEREPLPADDERRLRRCCETTWPSPFLSVREYRRGLVNCNSHQTARLTPIAQAKDTSRETETFTPRSRIEPLSTPGRPL